MSNTEKVDTSTEAVEARIAWLEANPCFGMIGVIDHHTKLAAMLRAMLHERDEARAHYNDVLAENDALRFERNNLVASLATARADALKEALACCERAKAYTQKHYGAAESVGADMVRIRILALTQKEPRA